MKKALLLTVAFALFVALGFSQTGKYWSVNTDSRNTITKYKAVSRLSFPTDFKLFILNIAPLRQQLLSVADNAISHTTTISLPNAAGQIEDFEVVEASNFEPALQARFPQIRAFSGRGITDRSARLKISLSPAGIQTMVFRSGKPCEFIEAYSQDHTVYAVFRSQRSPGHLPWSCSTVDQQLADGLNAKVASSNFTNSSTGELKTMRLAQSVTAEYSNYFGATSVAQIALVYGGINATLTRCNGVYETDLGIHLNIIPTNDAIIYFNPNTDPYAPASQGLNNNTWNNQLLATLKSVIGDANFDIGHLFGASGGGGNAGCIGCVCGNGTTTDTYKGSGITSPADNIPEGDNFDIDYVVHEVGHQMGANHTFSFQNEGTNVLKEIGSGVTIMGYAGITPWDVAPHSIDDYHEASIAQIQTNIAGKTCPVTTNISVVNATPVVAPVSNYTIPKSTPFALTGVATDANASDVLTYSWEQNDNTTVFDATTSLPPATNPCNAKITKVTGPNWISWRDTTSPVRICPKLATVLAGGFTTAQVGGDAGMLSEALSSVARTLHFRLTVRDNHPYSSTPPVAVGQTAFTDMIVTVDAGSGPFKVTSPNTNVSWAAGSTQTITWDVANSTAAPVSCPNVKITMSVDGGYTWPYVLSATTANDGTEPVTIPSVAGTTTARVRIESIGNIFFDIDDANFTITAPTSGFSFNSVVGATVPCGGASSATITLGTTTTGGFSTPIMLSAAGNPAGTTVTFGTNPLAPGSNTTVILTGVNTLAAGSYDITVTGTAGSVTQSSTLTYIVQPGTPPNITTQPAAVSVCSGSGATFTVASSTPGVTYQWFVNNGSGFTPIAGATSASYTFTTASTDNNNQYHAVISYQCGTSTSNDVTLTVISAANITTPPASFTACSGTDHTFSVVATGTNISYQWQVSTGGPFTDIPGATNPDLILTGLTTAMDGNQYQVVITATGSSCPSTTTTPVTLTVQPGGSPSITTQPAPVSLCAGSDASFSVLSPTPGVSYQWQVSTGGGPFTDIPGATAATYTLVNAAQTANNNQYQVVISQFCGSTTSTPVTLTVNTAANITSQPANVTICEGAAATFSVTATGTGLSYQWQVSMGGPFTDIPGATSATLTVSNPPVGTNQYQVVISATGSACPAPGISNVATLIVNAAPTVSATADVTAVCSGSTVQLTATGNAASYMWTASSGTLSDPTSATPTANPVVDPANPGNANAVTYTVTATTPGCSATSSVTVTANPLPVVSLVASPAISNLTVPSQTVTLTANVTPPGTSYTYDWTQNGLPISNSTNTLQVGVGQVGEYAVTVSLGGACASTSNKIAIADSIPDRAYVYPNPNDGRFSIQVRNPNLIGNVTVFDSKGARVFAQVNIETRTSFQVISVDMRPAASGVYVLTIYNTSGERIDSERIIVQH